jgi:hypothetical protein
MVGHVPGRACNPGPSRAYMVFLPPRILPSTSAYNLLGVEPIELVADRLTLTFPGNILQDKTTIEFQIVERQHAMMKTNTQN